MIQGSVQCYDVTFRFLEGDKEVRSYPSSKEEIDSVYQLLQKRNVRDVIVEDRACQDRVTVSDFLRMIDPTWERPSFDYDPDDDLPF